MILSCMWHVAEEVFSRVSVFLAAFRALAFSFSCARDVAFSVALGGRTSDKSHLFHPCRLSSTNELSGADQSPDAPRAPPPVAGGQCRPPLALLSPRARVLRARAARRLASRARVCAARDVSGETRRREVHARRPPPPQSFWGAKWTTTASPLRVDCQDTRATHFTHTHAASVCPNLSSPRQ